MIQGSIMRVQEIIKAVLELLDRAESAPTTQSTPELINPAADVNHFRQIQDLKHQDSTGWANEPKEKYADIAAVTTHAGGGINGPKHPADIRVKDPSATPQLVDKPYDNHSMDKHKLHQAFVDFMNRTK